MTSQVGGLICFPANTIVFAFIAFAPDNVHGLAQDQPDSITTPESFPELIKDSRTDVNSGQKRFSALLEWMRELGPEPLITMPALRAQDERARRGGAKMWSKGDVKDNASRFNNRKIFIEWAPKENGKHPSGWAGFLAFSSSLDPV